MREVKVRLLEGETLLDIVIAHPEGNVLTIAMVEQISGELAVHRPDAPLRLAVIRAAGSDFSFGVSIPEHRRDQAARMLSVLHALAREIASYPVPVAAVVQGRCLGGAFELALCCHLVFASAAAVFGCPEIRLGVIPPVLAAVGPLRLGGALSERLLLTGDSIDAGTAQRLGLVTEVFPESGSGMDRILAWYSKRLRPLSAYALRQATRASRSGSLILEALTKRLPGIERQYLEEIVTSHDGNEGIAAFLEHRSPVWTDS